MQKKWRLFVFILSLSVIFVLSKTETIKADEYTNAYTFYQTYGNKMLFQKRQESGNRIYYATKARTEVTGIQYTTIGWKVTIKNGQGILKDVLYFQLGGEYMSCLDVTDHNGYEYCLYSVSLDVLKSRMCDAARAALDQADAEIVFDACTAVKINGVVQGAMDDNGPTMGTVHETYDSIVNAQKWSSSTRETLKSYYNKYVEGLFYTVVIDMGEGIESVSGAGRYCVGSEVNISAKTKKGYHFINWVGDMLIDRTSFCIFMDARDIYLRAQGELNSYTFFFDPNGGSGEIVSNTLRYTDSILFSPGNITKTEARLVGWRCSNGNSFRDYLLDTVVSVESIVDYLGLAYTNQAGIRLYAIWDQAPTVWGKDAYVSLEDAQSGKITEEYLSRYIGAADREDGNISLGVHENNQLIFSNYLATDFLLFCEDGSVTESVRVVDSAGNVSATSIRVNIVDTALQDAERFMGSSRFISAAYYKDENGQFVDESKGGLSAQSIWRTNPEYSSLLDELYVVH